MSRKKEPERIEINRTKIMKVAKQMFYEQGIEMVKMSDLAKKLKYQSPHYMYILKEKMN